MGDKGIVKPVHVGSSQRVLPGSGAGESQGDFPAEGTGHSAHSFRAGL